MEVCDLLAFSLLVSTFLLRVWHSPKVQNITEEENTKYNIGESLHDVLNHENACLMLFH